MTFIWRCCCSTGHSSLGSAATGSCQTKNKLGDITEIKEAKCLQISIHQFSADTFFNVQFRIYLIRCKVTKLIHAQHKAILCYSGQFSFVQWVKILFFTLSIINFFWKSNGSVFKMFFQFPCVSRKKLKEGLAYWS